MKKAPQLWVAYLKPYLSFSVFVQPAERSSAEIVARCIRSIVADDERLTVRRDGLRYQPGAAKPSRVETVLALAYEAESVPPWWSKKKGQEVDAEMLQHLALVFAMDDLIAVHTTDKAMRDRLFRRQGRAELGGVGILKRPALEAALGQGVIRSFVMGHGAAPQGRPAPESKITYGNRLEETIDEIDDQHHPLNGMRATADESILGPGREGHVGVNYIKSGFWTHRPKTWREFVDITEHSLQAIQDVLDSGGGRERFAHFARYLDEIDEAENAYEITFKVPGLEPDSNASPEAYDAYDWFALHTVSVEGRGRHSLWMQIADESGLHCTLKVKPEKRGNAFSIEPSIVEGDQEVAKRSIEAFKRLEPVMYYESGHSVSSSGVVARYLGDAEFRGWRYADLSDVHVHREKPGDQSHKAIRDIGGSPADKSLFGWVIRQGRSGWLYCDDGSDELADFIQLEGDTMTVWHVKACSGKQGRRMAANPYYEVCLQAQKNATSLDPLRVANEMRLKLDADQVGPLWLDGSLSNQVDDFIAALEAPRASLEIVVALLQPHVTKEILLSTASADKNQTRGDQARLRRLNHMLISTQDAVFSACRGRLTVVTANC